MIDRFLLFGLASVQLIPILTLVYLQNEISILSKIFLNIPSKLLTLITIFISFALVFLNTFPIGQPIRIVSSILLIITLSLSMNYTYKDYTIDEGYYITIPYFIIYSCLVFIISLNEYPFYTIDSTRLILILISSFISSTLFFLSLSFGKIFDHSYLNYIAFLGLCISTINVIFIFNSNKPMKSIINFLLFQFVQIYAYLTHLLSVKFELKN